MKKTITILLLILSPLLWRGAGGEVNAQNKTVDSLLIALKTTQEDSFRLNLYIKISEVCEIEDNLKYAKLILSLADKLLAKTITKKEKESILRKKAEAYKYLVIYYRNVDIIKPEITTLYYKKRFEIYHEILDIEGIKSSLVELADYYDFQGNSMKRLETLNYGLSLTKKLKSKNGMLRFIFQIGFLYADQGDTLQALDYLRRDASWNLKLVTAVALQKD